MTAPSQPLTVKCPNCGRAVLWATENLFKPFCSERCKLIDLGEWANEDKRIPGDPVDIEIDDENNLFQ
ncbi:MAG: DNA gyrase inhibitor YacG [Methylococcaceae bacterium]|nr:DNA gyrase inhibitor YacG [Methylococcaceae bacterium]